MSGPIDTSPTMDHYPKHWRPNELRPEFLSINSLNPWPGHDSSSRGTMFSSSHAGQCLQIKGATPRRCQTGTEREFGRFTFKIKAPCDMNILKVIPKYPQRLGVDRIKENPSTLVIYENIKTKEIGFIDLIRFSTATDNLHQHFGFRYKFTEAENLLYQGAKIEKGTVIADSPAIDKYGNYRYGAETNVAFMSVPGIIEDGIVVSESYLDRIATTGFEKRTASWGKQFYPLNLYGDNETYKPFPDIGDRIRDDGLLFALRPYDELLGPVEMNPAALQEPDYIFDKLVYGVPGAKVADVTVHHDDTQRTEPTPAGMEVQTGKYLEALTKYYDDILDLHADLVIRRGKGVKTTPEFHRLIVEAISDRGPRDNPYLKKLGRRTETTKRKVQKMHRRVPLDDWRVEIAFEYEVIPTIGYKLTDCHGGKGVICDVWPDHWMPVDDAGNRAEVIMDGDSAIKRMNLGRLYEQYYNAASRDVTKRVIEMHAQGVSTQDIWNYLVSYYRTVSPRMADLIESPGYPGTKEGHIKSVMEEGVYLWLPTDNPAESVDIVKGIRQNFPPHFGHVTYMDGVRSADPVLIGSLYVILLEKTGGDWSGVSSSKLQHFGIPARVSNVDKYGTPGRNNPVRILGESEIRLLNATVGSDVSADLLDQSNSPATHKAIVNSILRSDKPMAEEQIIDRRYVPLGNSRSLLFVKHILECAGIRLTREIDDPLRKEEMASVTSRLKKMGRRVGRVVKKAVDKLKGEKS